MSGLKEYDIRFSGLKLGPHRFTYVLGQEFFDHYDYQEFSEPGIEVSLDLMKKTTLLELHFGISGSVQVQCDLSNRPFRQELKDTLDLVVKFGNAYDDTDDEVLILPHDEHRVNVAQYIYELVVLSLPKKRIHPDVEKHGLPDEIKKHLSGTVEEGGMEEKTKPSETDPRWDKLKDLFN